MTQNKTRLTLLLEILRRENKISPADQEDALEIVRQGGDPFAFLQK